jgi:hypothetical protein
MRELRFKSRLCRAAVQDVTNNGFTGGGTSGKAGYVTVTVNQPPLYGSYAGLSKYAEAIVTKTIPTSFMSIVGFPTVTVAARSVGGRGGSGACIYALSPTAQDAVLASGSATVNAGCGIIDESDNSKALEASGSGTITGSSIQVVGGEGQTGGGISPAPTTGITSPGDPLSGQYTAPYSATSPPTTCDATNSKPAAGATLSAGIYCGGITVNSGTVSFNPGLYVLYGGGLTVSGSGVNIVSNSTGGNGTGGVTFFNMDSGSLYGGYKALAVQGGSSSTLTAPTSGSYQGLLFWQDPTIPTTDYNKQNTVSGGSSTQFTGILYFPNSPLVYSGGSSGSSAYTIIVADTVTFSGPSKLNANFAALPGGNPIKTTAIVSE